MKRRHPITMLAGWLAVLLVSAVAILPATAQVADPEGDADVPCVDVVSVDVTATASALDVTAVMSSRPYPDNYVVNGIDDPNGIRLCPGGLYEVRLDLDRDGVTDRRLRLFFDYHGNATVAGPDSLSVDYSIRQGEVSWHVELADLGLEELPATVGLQVHAEVVNDGSVKPLVDVDAADDFPDGWQDVIVGAAAARLVGPAGGVVTIPDDDDLLGGTHLDIPEGALEEPTAIYLDHGEDPPPADTGLLMLPPVQLGPPGLPLAKEATLSYRLHGIEDPGIDEDWAFYRYDDDAGWTIVDEDVHLTGGSSSVEDRAVPPLAIVGLGAALIYELIPAKAQCLYYNGAGWEDVSSLVSGHFNQEPIVLVHGFQVVGDGAKICGPVSSPDDTFGQLAEMLDDKRVPVFALTYHTGSDIRSFFSRF